MNALRLPLLGILYVLAGAGAAAPAPDPTTTPTGLVRSLEAAYANRNIDAYRTLLADDFRFITGDPMSEGASWGLDEDLAGTGRLFGKEDVLDLRMTFTVRSVKPAPPGNGGMTMVEAGGSMEVTQAGPDPDGPPTVLHIEGDNTFYLRRGRTAAEARSGEGKELFIVVWRSN